MGGSCKGKRCGNDPALRIHDLSVYVCGHHTVAHQLIIGTCAERIRNTSAFLALGWLKDLGAYRK